MSKTASRGREQCWRTHTDTDMEMHVGILFIPESKKGIRGTLFFLKKVIKRGRSNWK